MANDLSAESCRSWLMIFPLSHVDHVANDLSAESCRSCG